MEFALACLPTVREEQVAAVAVVAAGGRMTKLGADGDGKQANNGYSVTDNCSGRRRVSGGAVLGGW